MTNLNWIIPTLFWVFAIVIIWQFVKNWRRKKAQKDILIAKLLNEAEEWGSKNMVHKTPNGTYYHEILVAEMLKKVL